MRRSRLSVVITSALTGMFIAYQSVPVYAQDWLGARSPHFRLIGTADDDDLLEVGARLEGFHLVVDTLFRGQDFRSPRPTTVIVLDDDDDVEDLGLTPEADGYFLPGRNENFIILSPESRRRKPFGPILRSFFEDIAGENLPKLPEWIKEGLAQFYSTIQFDDEALVIGSHIERYTKLLRDRDDDEGIPYDDMFNAGPESFSDNTDRKEMYSAQAWALIHFLMMRNRGPGLTETAVFVHSMAGGLSFEDAFQTSFSTNFQSIREDFEDYVKERSLPFLRMTVDGLGEDYVSLDATRFPPAKGETYLADLLLEAGKSSEGERRLRAAIARDSQLAAPHTSLGGLRLQQGLPQEALDSLRRAVDAKDPNYLSHYYYALAYKELNPLLSQEGQALVQDQLQSAIRLAPEFSDAHHELASTYVDIGNELDEAARLLDQALTLSPDHPVYLITLSRVLIEQGFPDAAKGVLDRVLSLTEDQTLINRVKSILESIEGLD